MASKRIGGTLFERDVAVAMRDGTRRMANLFRPCAGGSVPVVMSVTPYGKDTLPDRLGMFFMWLAGIRLGDIAVSRLHGGASRGRNKKFPFAEDFPAEIANHPLHDTLA
jgi:hypothetical protein